MIKHSLAILIGGFTVGLMAFPAYAGPVLSIAATNVTANPGDTGDTFEVDLTNTGSDPINIAAFSFEVSVTDPDITLEGADFGTVSPYIFSGNSFDQANSLTLDIDLPGSTLDAIDGTADSSDISLAGGATVGLGRVEFDVAAGAAPGTFAVSFTGGDAANNQSDSSGDGFTDTAVAGSITVTPEPATLWLLGSAVALFAGIRRPFAAKNDD